MPELNWYAIYRKKKEKVRVNRCGRKFQLVREGGTFDDQGLSSEIELHEVEQKAESCVIPREQESRKDGVNRNP